MNKAESKFFNTAKKMHTALFMLLDSMEFEQITISKICEKAKINRSTFYAHYQNTFELLEEAQLEFIESFFSKYKLHISQIEKLDKDKSNFITPEYLLPFLEFIKENKKFYRTYIRHLNVFQSEKVFAEMLNGVFIPVCKKHGVTDQTIIDYMARYYLIGITAIVSKWIEGGCADDILFICEIIMLCVRADKKADNLNF